MKFHIVTLGCPKNEVDSEGMEALLIEAGHCPVARLSEADVVIVNTCSFIDAATDESVAALKSVGRRKKPGSLLIAAGCLAQREGEALSRRVPEVDAALGCRRWPEIVGLLELVARRDRGNGVDIPVWRDGDLVLGDFERRARGGSAYVKISDGCDAACSFCAIPSIKGGHRSKPRARVVAEVRQLVASGVREVVLVGQDTTAYGLDRGEKEGLSTLLYEIAEAAPDLPWLRVLYLYPQRITPVLLRTLADLPQLCKYVDVPLQHTHPAVLRRMRRPHEGVEDLVARIRDAVPEVAIRTTFIVGFPGETEEEHRHLLRSIDEMGFDHVGVFAYSPQRGTPAAAETDQVAERTRRRRWREAMEVAQRVSLRQNRKIVGKELQVLVEGAGDARGGRALTMVGRSYRDAPEVDGLVLFSGSAEVGEMVRVRITSALQYDLIGEMVGGDGCEAGDGGTRGRAEGRGFAGAASGRRAAERVVGAGQRHVGG